MLEKIKELLLAGIQGETLISEISAHFFEDVEDSRKEGSQLAQLMQNYSSLRDFFSMEVDTLRYEDSLLLDDLMQNIEYELQLRFDLVEDGVKKELIEGKYAADVMKEVRAAGIVPIALKEMRRGTARKLTEDEVEEFYMEAFLQFDELRAAMFREIMKMDPTAFYDKGRESIAKEKESHDLLMDERDFLEAYRNRFDPERLDQLLARGIYEAIHFHRRYELEYIDLSDQPADPDADLKHESYLDEDELEQSLTAPGESEGVLEPVGDLQAEDYTYVYELLSEYNGHRILPSDDDRVSEAYWATYADDLGDMLGMYMVQMLEDTVRELNEKDPIRYDSLARYYHWDMEQRKDPETILSTSDKISFALADMQERIWMDFNEADVMTYYKKGEKVTEGFDYTGEGKTPRDV
ncbi:MAG: hypothetical protein HUJ69_04815 [Lachnospiraceae bacterium]|nr:hypothetical protein [Lachnospiraceae bacterium]